MIRPSRPMRGTSQLVRRYTPVSAAQPVATPLAINSQLFGVTFSSCPDVLRQSSGRCPHVVTIFVTTNGQETDQ